VSLKGSDPKPESLAQAQSLAASADLLIVATRSAHVNPEQLALARDLLGRAGRTILICLRNPYDAGVLEADAVICTCGDSAPSLAAAADALLGAFTPTSRLPVAIE
jgi:hypothetical protein